MAEHLCLTCALCCDGSVFSRVPVTEAERDRLGDRVEIFTKEDGSLRMRQPCRQLGADKACGCYEDRPGTCRDYACALLRRLERGTVTEAQARGYVADLLAARSRTRALLAAALGETPPADLGLAMDRLRSTPPVDRHAAEAAEVHYGFFTDLVRLHLKRGYRPR